MKPDTIVAQALGAIEPTTKAIVPPIHVATTYIRDPDNQIGRASCRERV